MGVYQDPPDDPVDGDTYGDVWIDDSIITHSDLDKHSSNDYSLISTLGYRYDTKTPLFNIPNLYHIKLWEHNRYRCGAC